MRQRDFYHTGLDVARSECQNHRLMSPGFLFGIRLFVDTTNGLDTNDGLTRLTAFKTIQAAFTRQLRDTEGLGDEILIAPGTYAESLVGTLTNCALVGTGMMPGAVKVRPTTSYAFHGGVIRSLVENIEFWSPSTSNGSYPAFYATYGSGAGGMNTSALNRCHFMGGHADAAVAIQIGARVAASVWEQSNDSIISNCGIWGNGSANEFATGINFFAYDSSAQNAKKAARRMHIFNNIIFAHREGIQFQVNSTNLDGSIIEENNIRGQASYGPLFGIKVNYAVGSGDQTAMVINNRICAVTDGIYGFKPNTMQGNIVSLGANVPVGEAGFDA